MRALNTSETRLSIRIYGIVQGVGFRPFVYSLACRHQLAGFVRNTGHCVQIEVQGSSGNVDSFVKEITSGAPPLAVIDRIDTANLACIDQARTFSIYQSESSEHAWQAIPADTATCEDCISEIFDEQNRRYLYPFTNCTNCGPRFTIIRSLPYDRPNTSMAEFKMCSACRREYDDPADRRFHAQPNACAECGPALTYVERNSGQVTTGNMDSIVMAVEMLHSGKILALKGLGGFHLACDASNAQSVTALRTRKGRDAKPFAVMVKDAEAVQSLCTVSAEELKLLRSPQRPIVLLKRLPVPGIVDSVAPGTCSLGVMLPYTPLHQILLRQFDGPLIMTSGNLSEEPIAIDNEEALSALDNLADGFLLHNRTIISRYDDSVARVFASHPLMIRRSRGFAPLPLKFPVSSSVPVLACGGHLKNTFCLVKEDNAFVSQHIGDLENLESLQHFNDSLERFMKLFNVHPGIIACDKHPDYVSTGVATALSRRFGALVISVQHHHAHIAACMAEYGLNEPVLAIAFDGLGFGDDETLWGGEFFVASRTGYKRFAHFEPVAMPGGSLAIKNPWRMVLSYLHQDADGHKDYLETLIARYGLPVISAVRQQLDRRLNSPLTSSCGRLFDAVSSLLGVCSEASYEGQAAIELECLAQGWDQADTQGYQFSLQERGGRVVIEPRKILLSVLADVRSGVDRSCIALRFHNTLSRIALELCLQGRQRFGISKVCLSGGVFQNQILLSRVVDMLAGNNFECFYPRKLPCNDGGLSFGQAVVALAQSVEAA